MTKSPAEVLLAAADLIERDGWWDGKGERPQVRPNCALMAISAVDCNLDEFSTAMNRFRWYIDNVSIGSWNDKQPNGEVVVAKMRACARSL